MTDPERGRVQGLPRKKHRVAFASEVALRRVFTAVHVITDNRMAEVGKVHADLVGSAGLEFELNQRISRPAGAEISLTHTRDRE